MDSKLNYDYSKLPLMALKEIGEQLQDLREIVKLSFVCKQWRIAYDLYFEPELLCAAFKFRPINKRLFQSKERIQRGNVFRISDFKFLESEITRRMFGNKIKKLIVYQSCYIDIRSLKFNFETQLNYFLNLEHLEIKVSCELENEDNEIKLSKLRILTLECDRLKDKLIFNTISLEILKLINTKDEFDYEFLYPETLKYFEYSLGKDTNAGRLAETISTFKNLEFLFLSKSVFLLFHENYHFKLEKTIAECLPNLKFVFNKTINGLNESNYLPAGSNEIRILEYGSLIIEGLDYKNLEKYTHYKDQLNCYPFEFKVNYEEISSSKIFLNLIKEDFIHIKYLSVRETSDQSSLIVLLKSLGYLNELSIKCRNLDQIFYDALPLMIIGRLEFIYDSSFKSLTDYSFLSNLNACKIYTTLNQYLPYGLLSNLFKNENYQFYYFNILFEDYSSSEHLVKRGLKNVPYCSTCGDIESLSKRQSKDGLLEHLKSKCQLYLL